jgi:hypothetical protein
MDLKNALAVCLLSLFSATLVLLIARALDLSAASRLEPQLAQIVEQLEAIRLEGGIPAASSTASKRDATESQVEVYYFHGDMRCVTCESIESQAHRAINTHFADELKSGRVTWKTLNYEDQANGELAGKFEVLAPVVVLARMHGGQLAQWKRLDEVWTHVDEEAAFAEYVRSETAEMLEPGTSTEADASVTKASIPE